MNRKQTLIKAFQRGHLLSLRNPMYRQWIQKFIVAGIDETRFLLESYGIKVSKSVKDGAAIRNNDVIMEIEGKEKNILKTDRSALDLLQRMSGIATLTYSLIKKTRNKIGIAPTRKTQWRYLDKKATYLGKGLTHRLALWESILIKDNHLIAIRKEGIKNYTKESIKRAWKKRKNGNFIEIEVTNSKEALEAAKTFKELKAKQNNIPCLVMLDNINPVKIRKI